MIRIIDGTSGEENYLNREIDDYGEYEGAVKEIIASVRKDGDKALYAFAGKFDGVELDSLEVPTEELRDAADKVAPEYAAMLRRAAENIREFHRLQLRDGFTLERADGTVLGQRISPVERAGIYVPGGTASYPSTVLMNAIPAAVAGVKEIVMVTPPDKSGGIKKEVLAAAAIAGVTRVFKIGGAGAIAALAFGTESVPRVDKITGPGNIYVALAKKLVFGAVGVDMIAGPSEILIVADSTADADVVAADMLSQAEHDRLASAVLVTDDETLARKVAESVERQLENLPRREIARAAIDNCGKIIVVDSIERAVEVSNRIAPEHLELCVENPDELFAKVTCAGSVFLGHNTPEAAGDYYAGANHTLPTGGSARFSSALSVDDFVRKTQFIKYSGEGIDAAINDIVMFAESEGLSAHARSAARRRK